MAILRRSPFRQLRELERQLDDLVRGGDSEVQESESSSAISSWSPRVDVYEEGDEIVFDLDAPGMEKDDLDVSLEKNRLTISGERREERDVEVEDRNYLRSERVYGTFKRSFALPDSVEADDVSANYEDGVLTVKAPKSESSTSQSVQIE